MLKKQVIEETAKTGAFLNEVVINTDGFYLSTDNLSDSPVKLEPNKTYRVVIFEVQ